MQERHLLLYSREQHAVHIESEAFWKLLGPGPGKYEILSTHDTYEDADKARALFRCEEIPKLKN